MNDTSTMYQDTINYLEHKRETIIRGGINCIPPPFYRFSNDFIGVTQGTYYIVTGATKSAKTQLSSYLFIYHPLLYCFNNPQKEIDYRILYFAWEETPRKIYIRWLSHILYILSGYTIRVSPMDLQSTKETKPLSKDVLDLIKSTKFKILCKYFEEHVEFNSTRNPTGMYKHALSKTVDEGKIYKKKVIVKDRDTGIPKEVEVFDRYEPYNPFLYRLVIWDHVGLTSNESGMNKMESIGKMSYDYGVELRDRYNMSIVNIQQQVATHEGVENYKAGKIRPSGDGLNWNKSTQFDCNIMLGIFSPYKHELPEYMGYNVAKLKDNLRFLEVCASRDGEGNGVCPLYFDGAVSYFQELPLPHDEKKLNEVYGLIKKNKESLILCNISDEIINKNNNNKLFRTIKNLWR